MTQILLNVFSSFSETHSLFLRIKHCEKYSWQGYYDFLLRNKHLSFVKWLVSHSQKIGQKLSSKLVPYQSRGRKTQTFYSINAMTNLFLLDVLVYYIKTRRGKNSLILTNALIQMVYVFHQAIYFGKYFTDVFA